MEIREVTTAKELYQVGRLRYDITVKERGLSMVYADHLKKTVIEPLDYSGHVYVAWDRKKIVGTIRTNYLRECDIGYYYEAYSIDRLPSNVSPYSSSITTRLAVSEDYRKTSLAFKLGSTSLQNSLENDIHHDIVDCRMNLVPMFKRLGYITHNNQIQHPEFGNVSVMLLSLNDETYLKTIRSPLYRLYKSKEALKRNQQVAEFA